MKEKIVVNKFPNELSDKVNLRGTYETVKYGKIEEFEIEVDDMEYLWGENTTGCQCSYFLVMINGKVYKYRSGCGWDKAVLARFENLQEYQEYCRLHKVNEKWLERSPALKP